MKWHRQTGGTRRAAGIAIFGMYKGHMTGHIAVCFHKFATLAESEPIFSGVVGKSTRIRRRRISRALILLHHLIPFRRFLLAVLGRNVQPLARILAVLHIALAVKVILAEHIVRIIRLTSVSTSIGSR